MLAKELAEQLLKNPDDLVHLEVKNDQNDRDHTKYIALVRNRATMATMIVPAYLWAEQFAREREQGHHSEFQESIEIVYLP